MPLLLSNMKVAGVTITAESLGEVHSMPALLERYQLGKNISYINKKIMKQYIESEFVKEIYLSYGAKPGTNKADPRYQSYIFQNYQNAYKEITPMDSNNMFNLGISGRYLIASNYQNAMTILSIIKAAVTKMSRGFGDEGGAIFQNQYAHGYLNIIKINRQLFHFQLVYDNARRTVILQLSQ